MERAVTDFLGKLGISDTESQLYVDLLELGPSSIAELTRKSTIPRTTVRENVERLIQKGLVSQTFKGARKKLVAEEPNKAKLLLMDRRLDLENQQRNLDDLDNKFEGFAEALYSHIPNIREKADVTVKFYEGKREVFKIYEAALQSEIFKAYVNAEELKIAFPGNFELFVKAHTDNKKMNIWEIMEDTPSAREYASQMPLERYFAKFVPKGVHFSVIDYMVFDGNVAVIDLKQNTSGLVISNDDYYKNASAIFDLMWGLLPGR